MSDPAVGTERVVVLAETREVDPAAKEKLRSSAQEVVTDIAGTPPDEIVLAPPHTVPKTSSGKIRRSAAKELYGRGQVGAPQAALWLQLVRLSLAGIGPQTRRLGRVLGGAVYATWWWTILAIGFFLAWCAVMVLPRLSWRWAAVRAIARAALAGIGVPVSVTGLARIPPGNAMLVFNHSSYMDVLLLSAVLRAFRCMRPRKNSPARASPDRSCVGSARYLSIVTT